MRYIQHIIDVRADVRRRIAMPHAPRSRTNGSGTEVPIPWYIRHKCTSTTETYALDAGEKKKTTLKIMISGRLIAGAFQAASNNLSKNVNSALVTRLRNNNKNAEHKQQQQQQQQQHQPPTQQRRLYLMMVVWHVLARNLAMQATNLDPDSKIGTTAGNAHTATSP